MIVDSGADPESVTEFFSTLEKREQNWGSHGIPRASGIGDDLLQQYYSLTGAPVTNPTDGEGLWGMDEGHWIEPQVYQVLRETGYLITDVQAAAVRYKDGNDGQHKVVTVPADEWLGHEIAALRTAGHTPFMTMHIDGIMEGGPKKIPRTLLELKKLTMFAYSGCVQRTVRTEKMGYRFQSAVCAASFGLPTTRWYIFSRDKSAVNWHFTKQRSKNPISANPALYVENMRIDEADVRVADFRALYLIDAIAKNKPPPLDPGISPLNVVREKNGELSTTFPCGWCRYKEHCLQQLFQQGVNINEYVIVDDLRTKAEKEKDA